MSNEYKEIYEPSYFSNGSIKTLDYCITQCERVAEQLKRFSDYYAESKTKIDIADGVKE